MILENIGDVLKEALEQLVGVERASNIDVTKLNDVADTVENVFGENGRLMLINKMLTRVYAVEVRNRTFKGDSLNVVKSDHEFGNIKEMVYFNEVEADTDTPVDPEQGGSYDPFVYNPLGHDVYIVAGRYKYKSKIYSVRKENLDMAFKSYDELDKFIAGYLNEFTNFLNKQEVLYSRVLVAQAIALTVQKGQTSQVRHLLTEYNTEMGGSPVTKTNSSYNLWKKAKIGEIMRKARLTSTLYNTEAKSIEESTLGLKLGMVKKAVIDMDLAIANVYHNDTIKLPEHQEVEGWQSTESGEEEKINITLKYHNEDVTANTDNVIGFIYDDAGIAITHQNRELRSQPNYLEAFENYKAVGEFESVIIPREVTVVLLDD